MDACRIRRVVHNLLTNTTDHGEGRPIDVTIASDGEAVAATVWDHGVGLEARLSGRVSNRSQRTDPSQAHTASGAGLGLATSLEDARLHRDWSSAWGRPDKGAQFCLILPHGPEVALNSSPLPVIPVNLDSQKDLR